MSLINNIESVKETLNKSMEQMLYAERIKKADYPEDYIVAEEGKMKIEVYLDDPKN